MNDKFINSIKKRVKSIEKEDDEFFIDQTKDQIASFALNLEYDEISNYHIAFMDLYDNNLKIGKSIQNYLDLLSDQQHYRENISHEAIMTMVRDLRFPKAESSNWQLRYETTLLPSQRSGPILHLYFDGWDIVDYNIYYWDESYIYDKEAEEFDLDDNETEY